MSRWFTIRSWFRSLALRSGIERELDEELRFHVDEETAAGVRAGLDAEEARRVALASVGGSELAVKEACRDTRGMSLVDDLVRDVRYTRRQLSRSPGFTAAAVLCLALGIGAATTIASIVNTVLLQPLPYPGSERLVHVTEYVPPAAPGRPVMPARIPHSDVLDWGSQAGTFSDAFALQEIGQRLVRTRNGPVGLWGAATTTNMFRMLGVHAMHGRTFDDADANDPDVAVLSFDAWRRHFGSDPDVVGTSIELHPGALMASFPPRLLTVVGVLPAAFSFPTNTADYYVLLRSPTAGPSPRVMMVAQLAEGASLESATDALNALGAASRGPWPVDAPALTATRFELERLQDIAVSEIRPQLGILLGSVVVLLFIVCANVANLLLARGTARHHEIALRLAIGASRGRLVRQMLTECLVLAAVGGALGALLAVAGVTLTKQLATVDAPGIFRLMLGTTILPRAHEVRVDIMTLVLAFGLAAATSIIFGLLPALQLSRPRAVSLSGVRGTAGMARSRTRSALVVSQLAMATILLVGAGLLIQSFVRLSGNNKGYDAMNVVALQLLLPNEYSTARKAEVVDTLLARLRQHPNVAAAGFARHGMLIGEALVLGPFVPRGRSLGDVERGAVVRPRVRAVSDGFLTAMNMSFIDGRDFGPNSGENDARVLVINRSTAREWFGTERAVGQVVSWHAEGTSVLATVIGVVDDVRQASLAQETFPEIYVEYHQLLSQLERHPRAAQRQNELAFGFLSFAIQTTAAPESMLPEIRTAVGVADPHAGIDALLPMARLVDGSVARERFSAVLLSVFASISGVLAALGVYGLLAYVVVQRTAEIGIRMALGAGRASVLRLVLGDGLRLTVCGVTLGLLAAVALSRSLEAMLFDISPLDLATFVVVGILFGVVAALAAYVPARRATRVDPLVAMRAE